MTREIKFRVRHGASILGWEKLIDGEWYWAKKLKDGSTGKWRQGVFNTPGFERDEYTDVLDENGMEIYEGDIISYVRCPEKHFGCICEKVPQPEFTDVVVFLDGAFVAVELEHSIGDYSVIGNIHENPELLEAQS